MRMMKYFFLSFLCSVFLLSAQSQASQDPLLALYDEANVTYNGEDYEKAIVLYDSILHQNYESPEVYYNLGNAHFRLGNVGQAILAYERSLKLDPSQEDVSFNLRLANLRVVDNIEPLPEFLVVSYANDFLHSKSSGTWSIWALGFLWAALAAGVAFLFLSTYSGKRLSFFISLLLVLISMGCLSLSLVKRGHEQNSKQAIVLSQNAYVKASPFGQAKDLVILHEGVKVKLMRQAEGWAEIKLSDSNVGEIVGWVTNEAIEEI